MSSDNNPSSEVGVEQFNIIDGNPNDIAAMGAGSNEADKKKKRNFSKSTVIDHTYSDFSTYTLLRQSEKPKGRVTFPMKLHAIISNSDYHHIICWMPHGRSWKILDKDLLASVVCIENFNHDSYGSFNRSVNGWGFKRLTGHGPDNNSYYHELFLRGRPDLTRLMSRPLTGGKRLPDPKGEPNFYEISKRFPLPDGDANQGAPLPINAVTYASLPRPNCVHFPDAPKRQHQGPSAADSPIEIMDYSIPAPAGYIHQHHYGYERPAELERGYSFPSCHNPPNYYHESAYAYGQPYMRRYSAPYSVEEHYHRQQDHHPRHNYDAHQGSTFRTDTSNIGFEMYSNEIDRERDFAMTGRHPRASNGRMDQYASHVEHRYSDNAHFQPIVDGWNSVGAEASGHSPYQNMSGQSNTSIPTPEEGHDKPANDAAVTGEFKPEDDTANENHRQQEGWSEYLAQLAEPFPNSISNFNSFGGEERTSSARSNPLLGWSLY